jgi:signal peptidase II
MKRKYVYILLSLFIFCLDRLSKMVALSWCAEKAYYVNSFLSCELAMNRGISWGLFNSAQSDIFFLVSAIIALFTGILTWYAYDQFKRGVLVVGEVCIITGSLSNIIDRVYYGGVIDFILLSYNEFSWPVFNVADMAIVIGVAMVLLQQRPKE